MKLLLAIALIFIFSVHVFAEDKRSIDAKKSISKFQIDGKLDESVWHSIQPARQFIQTSPNLGRPSIQKTEVRVAYDDEAIYIGAIMYESHIDSITKTLSKRDNFGNADFFGVVLDTYGSGTIGFAYLVTSAGVQIDELHGSDADNIDRSWNAVWNSAVTIEKDRWIAEIKIPYSAIRFPNATSQNWNVNFVRHIRRQREDSYWQYYDPLKINLLSQMGSLNGIKNIKTPLRLSLSPYVSSYMESYNKKNSYSINGGMDVKFGVNDAFTIDMTLIPDFGQVISDEQVLNLSPFEVRFNENRQFFTEGIELFSKGDLFYSRRIGGQPINQNLLYELDSNEIAINPTNSEQLINATKFSGRTKKGLGIGII